MHTKRDIIEINFYIWRLECKTSLNNISVKIKNKDEKENTLALRTKEKTVRNEKTSELELEIGNH